MSKMASQITSLTIVYSTVYSGADQRKHQSSASLVFVRGIHRWPVNYPHKWPVTRTIFPFGDVIIAEDIAELRVLTCSNHSAYAPSQWETTLHCNVVSDWLGIYIKWSLTWGADLWSEFQKIWFATRRDYVTINESLNDDATINGSGTM